MAVEMAAFLSGTEEGSARMEAAVLEAVDVFGEQVLGDAQELAPVATGALKASGVTAPAGRVADGVEKAVGFGVFYAVYVHEDLDAHHDQGEAKFLSLALEANAPKFAPFVQRHVKGAGF